MRFKPKYIFVSLVVGLLLASQFLPIVVFAADDEVCDVCGTPPAEFAMYKEFVYEVLGKINLVGTKWDYLGKYAHPGLFQAGLFKIPDDNQGLFKQMTKNITRNIQQKFWTMTATTAILFSIGKEFVSKDAMGGLLILTKQRPFVTVWWELLDIDAEVHDKIFDLWLSAGWNSQLTPENRAHIQKTFDKYTQEPKALFTVAKLEDDVRYRHITSMLLRINGAMKTYFAFSARYTWMFESDIEKLLQADISALVFDEWLDLKFDIKKLKSMSEQYACARGFGKTTCNTAIKSFIKMIKNIDNDLMDGVVEAKDIIVESTQELGTAFGTFTAPVGKVNYDRDLTDAENELLSKQADLLRTVYGVDAGRILEEWFLKIWSKNGREVWSLAKDAKNNTRSMIVDTYNDTADATEQAGKNTKAVFAAIKAKRDARKKQKEEEERWKEAFGDSVEETALKCLNDQKDLYKKVDAYIQKSDPDLRNQITNCDQIDAIVMLILQKEEPDANTLETAITEPQATMTYDAIENKMKNDLKSFLATQSIAKSYATFAGNKDMTIFFPEIFAQIHLAKEIIGSKDTDGFISNLWQACELQCANKGGTCYY